MQDFRAPFGPNSPKRKANEQVRQDGSRFDQDVKPDPVSVRRLPLKDRAAALARIQEQAKQKKK
jgi:hypothetical protein